MISLDRPDFGVTDIINNIGGGPRSSRVLDALPSVVEAEVEFQLFSSSRKWCEIPNRADLHSSNLADDFRYVYKQKMSAKNGGARRFYDLLKVSAPHSICPICMERDVYELDHYLPKEHWPKLAFVPDNLYPICTQCNNVKSSTLAMEQNEQFLHPYFDSLGEENWLYAVVRESPGAALSFTLEPSESWDAVFEQRVRKHFERFHLFELFRDKSASLLSSYFGVLESTYATSGQSGVSLFLNEMSDSFGRRTFNIWQPVAMKAWANSEWFCDAGWRM